MLRLEVEHKLKKKDIKIQMCIFMFLKRADNTLISVSFEHATASLCYLLCCQKPPSLFSTTALHVHLTVTLSVFLSVHLCLDLSALLSHCSREIDRVNRRLSELAPIYTVHASSQQRCLETWLWCVILNLF